jgi:hypothetical protein
LSDSFIVHHLDFTCKKCVLQWRYRGGNNWGKCEDGTSALGCGPQEEFRACADISIGDNAGDSPHSPNVKTTTFNIYQYFGLFRELNYNKLEYISEGEDELIIEKSEIYTTV